METGTIVNTYVTRSQYAAILSYGDVALLVMVLYDWVIHLGEEADFIWNKKLTCMTILYFLVQFIRGAVRLCEEVLTSLYSYVILG